MERLSGKHWVKEFFGREPGRSSGNDGSIWHGKPERCAIVKKPAYGRESY